MILGKSAKLISQFRLTYTMILNLLRVEDFEVEEMLRRSFAENRTQKGLPIERQRLNANTKALKECEVEDPGYDLQRAYVLSERVDMLANEVYKTAALSQVGSKVFTSGRIVMANTSMRPKCVAVLLTKSGKGATTGTSAFVLSWSEQGETRAPYPPIRYQAFISRQPTYHGLQTLQIEDITLVSDAIIQLPQVPAAQWNEAQQAQVIRAMISAIKAGQAFKEAAVLKKIKVLEYQEAASSKSTCQTELQRMPINKDAKFERNLLAMAKRVVLLRERVELEHAVSKNNLELLPEYYKYLSVLQDLGMVDENSVVQLKGRVAAEINTSDTLLLTELVLNNFFAEQPAPETLAYLSCLLFQEKNSDHEGPPEHLAPGIDMMRETEERLMDLQASKGIFVDRDASAINTVLAEVVYEWALGKSFRAIATLTTVLEGSIVRCIVRLDEACRELGGVSRVIGNEEMTKKMEECSTLIRRDIVFAGSLYL